MSVILDRLNSKRLAIVTSMESLTNNAVSGVIDPTSEDYDTKMTGFKNEFAAVKRLIADQTEIDGMLNLDAPGTVSPSSPVGDIGSGFQNVLLDGQTAPPAGEQNVLPEGSLILQDPTTGSEINLTVGRPAIVDKGLVLDNDPKGGFEDRNEFLRAVMNFGLKQDGKIDKFSDPRIDHFASMNVARRAGPEQFEALMNACDDGSCASSTDLSGSVFVPKEFAIGIEKTRYEAPTCFRTRRRTMGAPNVERKFKVDKDHRQSVSGGFKVGRNYEACCLASSAATYGSYWLNAHPLYGAYCASDMLMEMNRAMIIQDVEESMDDEFDHNRVVEILNGTGTGMYAGIWNSPALITVAPENGVNWTELTKLDIYTMKGRFWSSSNSAPVWIAGPLMETQVLQLNDGDLTSTTHIYIPGAGPDWADGTLLGIPICFLKETIPGAGYAGSIGIYDMMQYEEGIWRGMRSASSEHARFLCNQQVFKFWMYTAGQPTWASTLIPDCPPPYNGSGSQTDEEYLAWLEANATYSPFVVIGGADSDCPIPSSPHNLANDCGTCGGGTVAPAGAVQAVAKVVKKAGAPAGRGPGSTQTPVKK